SCEGIHPEACPLKISAGSRSVTVMTVALAFKAFAKAIPCLTPFLAISDPSVLKRILAYIRGLPCSSNIFPKKVILTYMVRSSPSVYGPISKLFMDQRASGDGRYCCKSLFVLQIKNSAGCGCDFHVRMWGTSSPDDKLMGDLG